MKKIRKQAKVFFRSVEKDLSYCRLRQCVNNNGYLFINLNTADGDKLLRDLGMYERCAGKCGKTILTDDFGIVAIDSNLSIEDKIKVMLHEIYHMNNHCTQEVIENTTPVERELEADAFVYEVLRLKNSILNLFV